MNKIVNQSENISHEDCIFCKIVAGTIPTLKVYEDDSTLAFLDIQPNNAGHALVIPKDHFENIYSLPGEALCRVILTAQKVAVAIKNGTDADGINIHMNNESAAGQEIFHAHIHVIPRLNEDGLTHWERKTYKQGEAEAILEKIKDELGELEM